MNGDRRSIAALLDGILAAHAAGDVELAVCPPFVYLPLVAERLGTSAVRLGAQNLCEHEQGAFTGEVAASMLRDYGVHYVIVGHSERRALYGESDERVAAKVAMACRGGLAPIVCVGESLAEREAGCTSAVVGRQLDAVLDHNPAHTLAQAVIAYEPVWAIGTGRTATPEQAEEVHRFIRERLAQRDAALAAGTRIVYGGSVNADNAAQLFAMADVDGGLVGGASLHADRFLAIGGAAAASNTRSRS